MLKKFVLLGSGKGSTARALLTAECAGRLGSVKIVGVISDRTDAGILTVANEFGVAAAWVDAGPEARKFSSSGVRPFLEQLDRMAPDYLLSVGFGRVFPMEILHAYSSRVMNLYPSLLPSFADLPNMQAVESALLYGAKVVGTSLYVLSATGGVERIIGQAAINVRREDTIDSLILSLQEAERDRLPGMLAEFATGPAPIPPPSDFDNNSPVGSVLPCIRPVR
jgi:phosphoribosylglycinamide formyltransferase 1